ncbi:MAG: hypothetical protein PHO32_07510 [Candidatus Cloacimonetes bacterium]|nr:hypothetical protein [Candidatus Cloacimonadota bacterium]
MIVPYPLQDAALIEECMQKASIGNYPPTGAIISTAFVPDAVYLSLGASNSLETHVHLEQCITDNVKIFKRLSGGESVLLTPACVVYLQVQISDTLPKSADFFADNLQLIISLLTRWGVNNVSRRGISDLAIGDKKILGSAIYRRPHLILFQAVLNVSESPDVIQRYLKHPPREPDYRKNRPHSEFVTSLLAEGYNLNPKQLTEVGSGILLN